MKKLSTIIIAVLIFSLCLAVTSFAAPPLEEIKDNYAVFSEDFQKLYVNDIPYTRVNTRDISYNYIEGDLEDEDYSLWQYETIVILSDTQKETVYSVDLAKYNKGIIFDAAINYHDGSTLNVSYIKDKNLEEYYTLVNGEYSSLVVDFVFPEDNKIYIDKNLLHDSQTHTFDSIKLDVSEIQEIYAVSGDENLGLHYGDLLVVGDDYYIYISEEPGTTYWESTEEEITVYKVTNEETKQKLDDGMQRYYEDDYGYMYNDDLLEGVSAVFLIIVFGAVPLSIAVTFIGLAIKARKKTYKKIFTVVSILSLLEVISFILTALLIFKK